MGKKTIILIVVVLIAVILGAWIYYEFFSEAKAEKILRDEILSQKDNCVNDPLYSEDKCRLIWDCVAEEVVEHYKQQRYYQAFARDVKMGKTDLLEFGIVRDIEISCALQVTIDKEFFGVVE
jgi:hypothetical protein